MDEEGLSEVQLRELYDDEEIERFLHLFSTVSPYPARKPEQCAERAALNGAVRPRSEGSGPGDGLAGAPRASRARVGERTCAGPHPVRCACGWWRDAAPAVQMGRYDLAKDSTGGPPLRFHTHSAGFITTNVHTA